MTRVQVKKSDVMSQNRYVICVGYCELQYLLRFEDSQFYTAGVYGWNADVFQINSSTVIVTGYRTFGNVRPHYELVREYEKKASVILENGNLSYFEKESENEKLISEFCEKAIENN